MPSLVVKYKMGEQCHLSLFQMVMKADEEMTKIITQNTEKHQTEGVFDATQLK